MEKEGQSVWISLNHPLTDFKKNIRPKKRLDVVLLNGLWLGLDPPGDSLHSSWPQLQRQLAYAGCLATSFPDIVLDAQNRA